MTDFDEIANELDPLPLLYSVTVATLERLAGTGRTTGEIGLVVWAQLGTGERRTAIPALLECYVSRVAYEQSELAHQKIADRTDIDSCLEGHDVVSAWDSVVDHTTVPPADHETVVDRGVLQRLLDEVDILRRRLDTAPSEATP